ncbi:MAG: alpha/beta fold hydrolase [Saprospiraceae bacterium]|nr:MAG: alpha/beta fold hydrolase [Saprospiraceae bacterium]
MELNYKEFGQGEPIIILHGLFGTLDNWQTIAKQLADEYSVFIIDQRNHGRSPHVDVHDYCHMVEDLREFMESHWIYNAHLIGHSMGGKTAMQFALEHPAMVNKLVVVDIAPKAYSSAHSDIFEALMSLHPEKIKDRNEANELLSQKIDSEPVRQFLLKNLSRRKNGGYELKMNLPVLYEHYDDILAAVEGEPFLKPTLFIRGGRSHHIEAGDGILIHQLFPDATIETIENAGHWVHAEQPAELLRLVREFLAN